MERPCRFTGLLDLGLASFLYERQSIFARERKNVFPVPYTCSGLYLLYSYNTFNLPRCTICYTYLSPNAKVGQKVVTTCCKAISDLSYI